MNLIPSCAFSKIWRASSGSYISIKMRACWSIRKTFWGNWLDKKLNSFKASLKEYKQNIGGFGNTLKRLFLDIKIREQRQYLSKMGTEFGKETLHFLGECLDSTRRQGIKSQNFISNKKNLRWKTRLPD